MTEHVYIHKPFCKRKCNYCSFVSGKNIELKECYLNTLIYEIKSKYKQEKLKTIYIGGGTPSLLDASDIQMIISQFNITNNCEITLEVNPETTITKEYKLAGVNRISLGIQTFDDKILKILGRNHNKETIYKAVNDIKQADFKNISIDLMYGLPYQTQESFQNDIKQVLELKVPHISSYGLKIEKGCYFYKNPPQNLPNEDIQSELYILLSNELKKNGYIHYEISNFALEKFESKHNLCYWQNKNYYGFGLNASGYIGNMRYKNQSEMELYLNNPNKIEEKSILTPIQIMEEEIFLALRLKEGINIKEFNKKYNIDFLDKYKKIINKYKNLINFQDSRISLNENGMLLSNEIMSEFID